MAIAKQNRLMTLAILLDMLMRSVFGEDEGLRKAKRQIRSRAVRQPSTRGGKGTKTSEALAERRGGNVQWTCRAQLHTSVIGPLLSPLGTDVADCHRAQRKEPQFAVGSVAKCRVQDARVRPVRSSRTINMSGCVWAASLMLRGNADRSRRHVRQQRSNFEQDSTPEGRFSAGGRLAQVASHHH